MTTIVADNSILNLWAGLGKGRWIVIGVGIFGLILLLNLLP